MEREILFRGLNSNNEWVCGALIKNSYMCQIIIDSDMSDLNNFINVLPETVGQFTGLTYGNIKIFDGDLLSWLEEEYLDGFTISRCSGIYEVKWSEDTLRFDLYDNFTGDWWDLNDTEFDGIIGNIHQNKGMISE